MGLGMCRHNLPRSIAAYYSFARFELLKFMQTDTAEPVFLLLACATGLENRNYAM